MTEHPDLSPGLRALANDISEASDLLSGVQRRVESRRRQQRLFATGAAALIAAATISGAVAFGSGHTGPTTIPASEASTTVTDGAPTAAATTVPLHACTPRSELAPDTPTAASKSAAVELSGPFDARLQVKGRAVIDTAAVDHITFHFTDLPAGGVNSGSGGATIAWPTEASITSETIFRANGVATSPTPPTNSSPLTVGQSVVLAVHGTGTSIVVDVIDMIPAADAAPTTISAATESIGGLANAESITLKGHVVASSVESITVAPGPANGPSTAEPVVVAVTGTSQFFDGTSRCDGSGSVPVGTSVLVTADRLGDGSWNLVRLEM
jgi:hypothetical protein